MNITGLNHVSITTANLDRALGFYQDLLGLELLGDGEVERPHLDRIIGLGHVRLRWAELDLGSGQILELFQYLEPPGTPLEQRTSDPGSVHLALNVDDIHTIHTRLIAAGVTTRSEPIPIPTGNWAGAWSLYAVDPDGVTIELIQLPGA
ncbi:MAG: VOC family protein [Mycobacteriales bacterium]